MLGGITAAAKVIEGERERRSGIALCPLFEDSIPVRNRCASWEWPPELHQRIRIQGPRRGGRWHGRV